MLTLVANISLLFSFSEKVLKLSGVRPIPDLDFLAFLSFSLLHLETSMQWNLVTESSHEEVIIPHQIRILRVREHLVVKYQVNNLVLVQMGFLSTNVLSYLIDRIYSLYCSYPWLQKLLRIILLTCGENHVFIFPIVRLKAHPFFLILPIWSQVLQVLIKHLACWQLLDSNQFEIVQLVKQ